MPRRSSTLQDEIKQTRPFRSTAEEVVVSILRTAAVVQRHLAQVVEAHGITIQQYNVLRILRGAGEAGLPTLAIRDRMVEEAAGITGLDAPMDAANQRAGTHLDEDERQQLIELLGAVRAAFTNARSNDRGQGS